MEVAGLMNGAANPKIKPETAPPTGPKRGAIKLEDRMLAKVIQIVVPGTG